ncbi:hypothetical protein EPO05_02150 [Patescibacteria group bacterium]|nr:MAG: hypothetical protein EPO05_02150 [Patescibacteria group bacterium]
MQKIRKNLPLVAIIGILFATGIVFSHAFTKTKLGTSTVLADEEESSSGERDSESSNDRDDDEGDNVSSRDNEDNNDGDKQDDEDSTEVRRVRTTTQGTTVRTENENDNEDGDKVENDNENENDSQEGIQELNKDISRVESRISVLSANGVSVTSLTATLSEIKDLASQAQSKLVSAPKEAESLIETADHKLERLSKLVKLTLGDEDENDDSSDATEEIQDLAKSIAKIEIKLTAVASRGVDISALKLSLNEAKDLLDQAKDKATAGDLTSAEALAELADKKLETLKHAMELALGDNDEEDGDEAKEYKNEVASFVHNLKEIGDIDGGIGQQVRVVAQAQNDSASKVEESINEVNDRSGFVRFLIGPKYGSIAEIQIAITENQTRIKVLTDLLNQINDPAVKLVLQDQIKQFQQENTRLQAFVIESDSGVSLFGWLMKMFA